MELVLPRTQSKLEGERGADGQAVLSVLSGKGGVGKTIVSTNLAVALASRRGPVLLMDCDLSAGQAHLVLGLCPSCGLAQVVRGGRELKGIVLRVGDGLMLAPGGPPGGLSLEIRGEEIRSLVAEARRSVPSAKALILDGGPGSVAACADFADVSNVPLVLTTPEPTAVRATVALLEAILSERPESRPCLLVNMAADEVEASTAFEKIRDSLVPVFSAEPEFVGWLPNDPEVGRSLRRYRPIVTDSPASAAAAGLRGLADELIGRLGEDAGTVVDDGSVRPASASGRTRPEGDEEAASGEGNKPGTKDLDEEDRGGDESAGGRARAA